MKKLNQLFLALTLVLAASIRVSAQDAEGPKTNNQQFFAKYDDIKNLTTVESGSIQLEKSEYTETSRGFLGASYEYFGKTPQYPDAIKMNFLFVRLTKEGSKWQDASAVYLKFGNDRLKMPLAYKRENNPNGVTTIDFLSGLISTSDFIKLARATNLQYQFEMENAGFDDAPIKSEITAKALYPFRALTESFAKASRPTPEPELRTQFVDMLNQLSIEQLKLLETLTRKRIEELTKGVKEPIKK